MTLPETAHTSSPRKIHSPKNAATVRRVAVSPEARMLSTLPHIDYADAFMLTTGAVEQRTGEQWARAVLEDAPVLLRRQLLSGWFALGLKLDPARSDRVVLGWELRHSGPDFALLGAGSRLGMPAELLFWPERDTLLLATFVQHRNPAVRAMWAGIAPTHRQIVPRLLARGAHGSESASSASRSMPVRDRATARNRLA
jgi:hypothetical protein